MTRQSPTRRRESRQTEVLGERSTLEVLDQGKEKVRMTEGKRKPSNFFLNCG